MCCVLASLSTGLACTAAETDFGVAGKPGRFDKECKHAPHTGIVVCRLCFLQIS